ncbi:hypothetical protein CBR_g39735 [Chara braunii]|uniref:Helicase C-terminal domain-containing protein n=1 Tax=Chara braunii TaxID=69332 RepID=A0A388LS48_CHABU|nr:hypothetical protein CBR_g39735 [Chara braunii]|eukprot:GBG85170.1 hypothetical protein CBR_g39735 [Chara braunii]
MNNEEASGTSSPYACPTCSTPLTRKDVHTSAALRDCCSPPGETEQPESGDGADGVGSDNKGTSSWAMSSKINAVMDTLMKLPKLAAEPNHSSSSSLDGKAIVHASSEDNDDSQELATNSITGLGEEGKKSIVLHNVKSTEAREKALVFSQWTSMLDLLEVHLKERGLNFRRLDGTMSVAARDRAVMEFKTQPEVTVMLMSLKAASLGLNLVAACHVLLTDIWWNPTTEDQAIDRSHRIGQLRPVNVSRFTVKNTIEDRILALQEKKRQMVASAFGETCQSAERSRLTLEDLHFLFRTRFHGGA